MSFLFNRGQGAGFDNLNVPDYHAEYFNSVEHTLVDVRTTGEFMNGHVPGAINIPLHEMVARTEEIPTDKPVVVICATGNRSRTGANHLVKSGYENVYNLAGGTMTWMMNGLPLER